MVRKLKYSLEEKIKACKDYEQGIGGFKSIAESIGAEKSTVRLWYIRFKTMDLMPLKDQIIIVHIVKSSNYQ